MALIDATKKKVVKKPTGQVAGATTSAYTPEQQQIVDRVNAYRTAKAMDIPGSLDMPDNGIDYASLAPNTSNGGRPETLADVMSGRKTASRTPASMLPSVKNSKNPYTSRTVAGNKANSAGAFYGSAGTPSLGTDIAGNNIMGTLGGRNVIGGKVAVDRTAGIQDPMAQYMQMLSPQSVQQRQKATYDMMAKERRGQLDAIRDKYKAQINEEQAQGQQDLARMRSINLRSGLGGSDFGVANKIGIREGTQKNIQAIQANQDIELGNTLNQIEELAQARTQIQQNALQQGFQNMFQMQEYEQAQQNQARDLVKELGANGLDIETIKKKDPALYEQIVTSSGLGEVQVEALMNGAKETANKIDYTWKVVGNKILGYGLDPVTGMIKQVSQDLDVEIPENYTPTFAPDGTLLFMPDNFDPNKPMNEQVIAGGNYAKPLASSGDGSGISNQSIDNERALMGQFRSEPIVKNYNEVLNKKLSVDAIIANGASGPSDLALVFEFMKALDPTSVVRESEYAAAAQSGNIFAGAWTRFNKGYFSPEGGILPEQVKQDFSKTVNSKLEIAQGMYDNLAKQYTEIASRQQLDPRNVVIGYSGSAPQQGDTETVTAQNAPVGSIVMLNGRQYKKTGEDNYEEVMTPQLRNSLTGYGFMNN